MDTAVNQVVEEKEEKEEKHEEEWVLSVRGVGLGMIVGVLVWGISFGLAVLIWG